MSNLIPFKSENLSEKRKVLTSQSHHQHHITYSQNIINEIKTSVTEAITSIKSLDYSNKDADKTTLLSEANVFLRNIYDVLFNLRVISLYVNEDNSTKNNLLNVIDQLEDVSEKVGNGYNAKLNVLEVKLKDGIKQIEAIAVNLLKIIELGGQYEHKQELVDMLSDLLSSVERIRMRNEIRNFSKEDLELYYVNAKTEIVGTFRNFKIHNETVLCCMIHHIRRGTQHMLKVVHHLQKYSCHYDRNIGKVIDDVASLLQDSITNYYSSFRMYDTVERASVVFEEILADSYGYYAQLLEFLDNAYYGKGYHNLKEIVIYANVEAIVNGFQLRRGLLDTNRLTDSLHQSN